MKELFEKVNVKDELPKLEGYYTTFMLHGHAISKWWNGKYFQNTPTNDFCSQDVFSWLKLIEQKEVEVDYHSVFYKVFPGGFHNLYGNSLEYELTNLMKEAVSQAQTEVVMKNERLIKALNLIKSHFNDSILSDQMGEDYSKLKELLK